MRSKELDWPRNAKGNYLPDHGKLPLHVHAIQQYLADPVHHHKSVGRAMYALQRENGRKLSFTNVDCERMKRNCSFWHRQNINEPYEVFKERFRAVFEHHYGDHDWCVSVADGGWCKYKNNPVLIEEARAQNGFRDKIVIHQQQYQKVFQIFEHFSTDDMMKQLYHHWSSQKNESLNQQVMRVMPKDKRFSLSMEFHDQLAWVVIVDSLGYEAGANRLFSTVGFGIDPITAAYLDRRNMKRAYDAVHFIRPDIKTERIRLKAKMIKDGLRELPQRHVFPCFCVFSSPVVLANTVDSWYCMRVTGYCI